MRSDDLVPILAQGPGPGLRFRQGIVQSWNTETGENTITSGGAVMNNVPILNTGEAIALKAGHVVGLLTWNNSWFILGRITVPGDASFAGATLSFQTAGNSATNFTIDASISTKVDVAVTIPAWADETAVMCVCTATAVNTQSPAAPGQALIQAVVGGEGGSSGATGLQAFGTAFGNFAMLTAAKSRVVTASGPGTITCANRLWTNGGTWPGDPLTTATIDVIAIFRSTA